MTIILSNPPYPIENDVLVLNEENFSQAKREFKYLLVLFYDPECPHCVNFMPEFERAASLLKKESFILAKFDSIKGEKIGIHYDIEAFPTVMLIKKDENVEYDGKRKAEEIEKWLIEKTKPEFRKISSKEELEKAKKDMNIFLAYFGKDEKVINEIIIAERKIDDLPIYTIDSEELIKENVNSGKKGTLVIFKKFDDKKIIYNEELTASNIINFVNRYLYPKVILLSQNTTDIIFTKRNPALVLFFAKKKINFIVTLELLNKIWAKIDGKIKLFICDIEDNIAAASLAEFCSITINNVPKIFIIDAESENPIKYEMEEDINEKNILEFITKWSQGELTPFLRSEEIPKKNNGDLFVLVGKNFREEVLNNNKDVLIYFTSPRCRICNEFKPKLKGLARKLKGKNPNLLFATMDATVNDVEGYQINNFPTFKFYPGNAKDKDPLNFYTRRNITSLIKFVKTHSYHKIIDEEEEEIKKNTDL